MKNYFTPILAVLSIFTMSLAVTSSGFAQETTKQPAEAQVEATKPSLTYYYIDQ